MEHVEHTGIHSGDVDQRLSDLSVSQKAKDKIIALLEQQAASQAEKEVPAASMPGTARGSRPNMI